MKLLLALNAFKGTLTASEASTIIHELFTRELPSVQVKTQDIADGGDGTCALLIDALGIEKVPCLSLNALGKPVAGFYGWEEHTKTAYLDVSTCSGLSTLANEERNPRIASTYGTGILVQAAISRGAEKIVLGLGGSASIDLGIGILQALGYQFLDAQGRELSSFSADILKKCKHIQGPIRVPRLSFLCLADVTSCFFGEDGAIPVFGPQKGLKYSEMDVFTQEAHSFIDLLSSKSREKVSDQPGFGAAGGIAYGLSYFFPLQLEVGATYFFEKVGMLEKIKNADFILTGEGKYDSQSKHGKGSHILLRLARQEGKKIGLISSGKEGKEDFDFLLQLPEVDLANLNAKKIATKNLSKVLSKAISKGVFTPKGYTRI